MEAADQQNYEELLKASEGLGFFSSLWSHGSWTPTSADLLQASEARLLSGTTIGPNFELSLYHH